MHREAREHKEDSSCGVRKTNQLTGEGHMETKRAVGYVRVSTEEQARGGVSLDTQEKRIRAYAESQGWMFCGMFREEGASGKDLNRPQLQAMLTGLEADHVDVVLVYRVDRLTRKQKDLWSLLEDVFEKQGVGFKSVVEPFDTTTAQGKAFLGMLGVFAQLERDTIAERTKDALAHKKRNGDWVGRVPTGFTLDEGRLAKDPRGQKIIARAKRLRRAGATIRTIAKKIGLPKSTVAELVKTNGNSRNSRYANAVT